MLKSDQLSIFDEADRIDQLSEIDKVWAMVEDPDFETCMDNISKLPYELWIKLFK